MCLQSLLSFRTAIAVARWCVMSNTTKPSPTDELAEKLQRIGIAGHWWHPRATLNVAVAVSAIILLLLIDSARANEIHLNCQDFNFKVDFDTSFVTNIYNGERYRAVITPEYITWRDFAGKFRFDRFTGDMTIGVPQSRSWHRHCKKVDRAIE